MHLESVRFREADLSYLEDARNVGVEEPAVTVWLDPAAHEVGDVGEEIWPADSELTPELLFFYLRKRTESLDEQIMGIMSKLEDNIGSANGINDALATVQAVQTYANARDGNKVDLDAVITVEETQMTVRDALQRAGVPFDLSGRNVSDSAIASEVDRQKSELQRTNSGTELDMVRLQSLMQQRAEALTMGTQMLKAMSDAKDGIVRNIG